MATKKASIKERIPSRYRTENPLNSTGGRNKTTIQSGGGKYEMPFNNAKTGHTYGKTKVSNVVSKSSGQTANTSKSVTAKSRYESGQNAAPSKLQNIPKLTKDDKKRIEKKKNQTERMQKKEKREEQKGIRQLKRQLKPIKKKK